MLHNTQQFELINEALFRYTGLCFMILPHFIVHICEFDGIFRGTMLNAEEFLEECLLSIRKRSV